MTGTSLVLAGALSGVTTGAFSGQVNVGSLVSGGAVSGTIATFSDNVTLSGGLTKTLLATNITATFNVVNANAIKPVGVQLLCDGALGVNGALAATTANISQITVDTLFEKTANAGVEIQGKTNNSSLSSGAVGYSTRIAAGSDVAFSTNLTKYENVTSFSLPPGEWEVDGNVVWECTAASGNATTQVQFIQAAISTSSAAFDDDTYVRSSAYPQSTYISTGEYQGIAVAPRTIRGSASQTIYLVARYSKATTNTNAAYKTKSYIRIKRIG
jgi:hypothetical protein